MPCLFGSRSGAADRIDTGHVRRGKTEGGEQGFARMSALGRPGKPDDIAQVVAFLAGDESRWVTGHILRADGGLI